MSYATYLSGLAAGVRYAYDFFGPASPPKSPIIAADTPEKPKHNLELTSAIRIGMFPYAKEAKITVEELAVNFDFPRLVFGVVNTTPAVRTISNFLQNDTGIGGKYLVVVKQITAIMLRLFPPTQQQPDEAKSDINVIYDFYIDGLEFLKAEYFPKEAKSLTEKVTYVPDVNTFDYDPVADSNPTGDKAAIAVQESINLLKYYQKNPLVYTKKKPEETIHKSLKRYYTPLRLKQLANGLLLLKEKQGTTAISAKWLCHTEFLSLDILVHSCLQDFRNLQQQAASLSTSQTDD